MSQLAIFLPDKVLVRSKWEYQHLMVLESVGGIMVMLLLSWALKDGEDLLWKLSFTEHLSIYQGLGYAYIKEIKKVDIFSSSSLLPRAQSHGILLVKLMFPPRTLNLEGVSGRQKKVRCPRVVPVATCYLARLTVKCELVRDCPAQPLLVPDHFLNW